MAGETSEPGAGGAAATPGSGEGGGSSTPPAAVITAPAVAPGQSIPIDVLPEDFRGLPENQIRFLLQKMKEGLELSQKERQRLEKELQERSKPAAQAAPEAPPKPLEEWILEDPEKALDYWANQKFGSAINRLSEVEDRVGEAEFEAARRQFDDFGDVEDDVREILTQSRVPKSRENILGAYTMAVGRRAIAERGRTQRSALNPETPATPTETPVKQYQKSALAEEIRLATGMSEEDYYENLSADKPLSVKVPGER